MLDSNIFILDKILIIKYVINYLTTAIGCCMIEKCIVTKIFIKIIKYVNNVAKCTKLKKYNIKRDKKLLYRPRIWRCR